MSSPIRYQPNHTHAQPVYQRNRRERGKVEKTWNRSNKAGRRNEIGRTAKTETQTPTLNSGQGLANRNNKKIITEGGLRIENTIVKQVASFQPQQITQQPQYFKKRIGATYYKVAIYKSNTSTENIEDKILRLAKNDATNIAIATSAKGAVNQ